MPTIDELVTRARDQITAGRLQDAGWTLQKLVARDPNHDGVIAVVALFEYLRGNRQGALAQLQQGVRRFPASAVLHEELGMALEAAGDRVGAESHLRESLRLDPNRANALAVVAQYLTDRGEWEQSEPLLRRLLELDPAGGNAWNLFGNQRLALGLIDEADAALAKAIAVAPDFAPAVSNRAALALYRDDLSPEQVFSRHQEYAARFAPTTVQLPARDPGDRRPGRLRVGYVSSDFRSHSVATFFEPVLAHHDRSVIELTCYSSVASPDAVTARMHKLAEHWRNILMLDSVHAAQLIRNDEIDVLIDLTGHTGQNRLRLFALKPAPVQLTWLGYPGTTGLRQIDYRLTDAIADPTDASQQWHAETLVRLPGTFFCYGGPGTDAPEPARQPPQVRNGRRIMFGVPTNIAKVRPAMIRTWSRLLARIPGARLMIKALAADTQTVGDWIRREFAANQIDPTRIELSGRSGFADYLRLHDDWDVALDTFPFNGHTTTCHALWMGVPVVTLCGQMHASRLGASVLHAIGLDELVAANADEYVEIAADLAVDLDRLGTLRGELRSRLRASPMMDAATFTRNLECVLKKLARPFTAAV